MSVVKTILNVIVVSVAIVIGVIVVTHAKTFNDPEVVTVQKIAQTAIAAKQKAANIKADTASLHALVGSFAQPYGAQVGVVVTDLSDGATANVNGSQEFVSASIYKLFVAYDIYRQIDNGTVSYTQQLSTPDDESATNSVSGCLNLMITVSDNGCGEALGALDGWVNLDTLLTTNGYTGTMLNNYNADGSLNGDKMTTANDVALLLGRLYNGTLVSAASSNAFLTLLKAQTINDRLPQGLPAGTVIAHKTGDLYGYLHDAGIIYGPKKDTVVVLMTGDWDEPQTEGIQLFKTLASSVWSYMSL
jgi:beta-lactamase class A